MRGWGTRTLKHQNVTAKKRTSLKNASKTVVLLGAGQPYRGQKPSAFVHTPDQRRVIDWLIDAFAFDEVRFHFVGGYRFEEIAQSLKLYPHLTYSYNVNWETTGSVASLLMAPLPDDRPLYAIYTDIVMRRSVIKEMDRVNADVVIAIDENWHTRYENRLQNDLNTAEKVRLDNNTVLQLSRKLAPNEADAEFAGIVKLSPLAISMIKALKEKLGDIFDHFHLPFLIDQLIEMGVTVKAIDVQGHWAELNAPQDLARFVLGTKAETLDRLRPLVTQSTIGKAVTLTVKQWKTSPNECIHTIQSIFRDAHLIVRSSALTEDGWQEANAGVFLSKLNIDGTDKEALGQAIEDVILSYPDNDNAHQVLIQKMVLDVALSGVAFTRTITFGAPYYVLSYDESTTSTETVTSGMRSQLQTLILHRNHPTLPPNANPMLSSLLDALKELEALVGHDCLDIEFAISCDGTVHIFQVRPMTASQHHWQGNDALVEELLQQAEQRFDAKQEKTPFIEGEKAIFGVMPDWNPAEIIGTSPRPLAASLYQYLIMDDIWATQRAEYGYADVRPHLLMVHFAGHPYVDIRASFNSFIPASIPKRLRKKLVNYYMRRLETNPHWHDKVEFDVLITCLNLNIEDELTPLKNAGFSHSEIKQFKEGLREITLSALTRNKSDLNNIAKLSDRYDSISTSSVNELDKAFHLLEDCRRYGTLPFSHLARSAFIAVSLLRSAVSVGILSSQDMAAYLNSIKTVAKGFAQDTMAVTNKALSWHNFISRYGHLRPGTYEITWPSYKSDPEHYLKPGFEGAGKNHNEATFTWTTEQKAALSQALNSVGLPEDMNLIDQFIRQAIEGREYAKFIFSRNLSTALDCLEVYGKYHGFSTETLSYVPLSHFEHLRSGLCNERPEAFLSQEAKKQQQWHGITRGIELPSLITKKTDFRAFLLPENEPNFISANNITAGVVSLQSSHHEHSQLTGNIVLIPQADPGYDWLFSHKIGGLITAYGGANSHMAIRAAEFALPAAIGVGEAALNRLSNAKRVCLDCSHRRIELLE